VLRNAQGPAGLRTAEKRTAGQVTEWPRPSVSQAGQRKWRKWGACNYNAVTLLLRTGDGTRISTLTMVLNVAKVYLKRFLFYFILFAV
jgi:hypothetical protein